MTNVEWPAPSFAEPLNLPREIIAQRASRQVLRQLADKGLGFAARASGCARLAGGLVQPAQGQQDAPERGRGALLAGALASAFQAGHGFVEAAEALQRQRAQQRHDGYTLAG